MHEEYQEQQNDQAIAELASKVERLREITISLGEETKSQNNMLDSMVRLQTADSFIFPLL